MEEPRRKGIVLFFMGPPASGRSTQAKMLVEALPHTFTHIENSDLIAAAFASGREKDVLDDGEEVLLDEERRKYDTGEFNYIPWILWLVRRELDGLAKEGKSVILTASPRSVVEAVELLPFLAERFNLKASLVIHFDGMTKADLADRARNRGEQKDADYGLRYRRYEERTLPTLDYMRAYGIRCETVDASLVPETVHACILHQKLGAC